MASKFTLVCRPVQSGKTFICIQEIKNDLEDNPNSVHIILTMNTICSNNQFANRVIKEIQDKYGSRSIVIFNSKGGKKYSDSNAGICKIKKIEEMSKLFTVDKPRIIIMCCHKTRITNYSKGVMRILFFLQQKGNTAQIHIDEIHKYIRNEFRYSYEDFHDHPSVENIRFYTATPRPLFVNRERWRTMNVVDQRKFLIEGDKYFGIRNSMHCQVEISDILRNIPVPNLTLHTQDTADYEGGVPTYREWGNMFSLGDEITHLRYVHHVLQNCEELHKKNNTFYFAFVPGTGRRVTHIEITNIVFSLAPSAHVCVINGKGINIHHYVDGVREINHLKMNSHTEINEELVKYTIEHPEVLKHPFVITGEICVGMSVSLVHPHYGNFHTQILTHYWLSDEDLYQLCRMCFSHKHWNIREKTLIRHTKFYCPKSTMQVCQEYENIVFELLEKHSEDIEHYDVGMSILPEFLETDVVAFDTFENAHEFIVKKFKGRGPSQKRYHNFHPEYTEFYLSGHGKKRKIAEFDEVITRKSWGLREELPWRLCPCYKEIDDPDTLQWVVAYLFIRS